MEANGWKSINEVWIPPLETVGFTEDVIIRDMQEPVSVEEPVRPAEPPRMEELVRPADPAQDAEGQTVLLSRPPVYTAYVVRRNSQEKVCVNKDRFVIGKSVSADYTVRDNPTVSRQHAAVTRTADGWYLEDLGSSNHTFLNGDEIRGAVKLVNGMVFTLSDEEFEFILE